MPHQDYDALRAELRRDVNDDPLTFTLFGHLYTCAPAPSLGDSFDLMDAPEPMNDEPEAVRALCRFIRRMLIEPDKIHWDQATYKLDGRDGPLIIAIGVDLTEQYANRPTEPPSGSSDGRPGTGAKSNAPPASTPGPAAPTP